MYHDPSDIGSLIIRKECTLGNGYPLRLISYVILWYISELAPTVATYYGNRSAAFMMLGTYDKALEDAQNAIRIDENFLKVC